jgi:hypothetical protein
MYRYWGLCIVGWVVLVGCSGGTSSSQSSPLVQASAPDDAWVGDCLYCSDVIDYHGDKSKLCAESVRVYEPFQACACSGVCAAVCADSYCAGGDTSLPCRDCLNDFHAGCGTVHENCENF